MMPQNLFFGPEQGRDFLVVKDIVLDHKFTLIGPKTDIGGVFHGPLFYYLLAIPFLLSSGNPLISSIFLILIQCSTVILIYLFGKMLVNERVGIISSLLFAVSFNSILFARWLSNPPLSIPFVVLTMLFLLNFLKGSKKSLIGFSICLGLLSQAEFLNTLFYSVITLGTIIIFFDRFNKIPKMFLFVNFLISIITSVGTFVIFDLRHQFLILKSILAVLTNQSGYHLSFNASINSNISGYFNAFTTTIIPFHQILGVIIFLVSLIHTTVQAKKIKEYYLIILWLIVPLILLILLRHDALEQFFVSIIPAFIILVAFAVDYIWSKSKVAASVLLIIILMQFIAWVQNIPVNKNIFFQSTQLELSYKDELSTIDQIYKDSNHVPFAIQAYTIPYWSQEGWRYLFWSYGTKKYGIMPSEQKNVKKLFVIVQDDPRNVSYQEDWLKKTVSTWGIAQSTFRYGILTTRELKLR
ncbi:MAG TPA: glycosyltransferase family 39 protein [Candidatus Saccharimonadales bacterium]|nr:glycosyltransferase family 39 protein [Candidatus Saccharimonadales bacterium]